jgi:hypothetical protein
MTLTVTGTSYVLVKSNSNKRGRILPDVNHARGAEDDVLVIQGVSGSLFYS